MKLTFLTPGTGHTYCENCLHDNMLVRELRRQGHDARMYPLYLPLVTEESDTSAGQSVQLGGINMYLGDHVGIWNKLPYWLTRPLDSRAALKQASRRMGMTSPADLGKATVSMASRSSHATTPDLDRLIRLIGEDGPGDAIVLSNIMLIGMAAHLKAAFNGPIVCQMQGEDQFLDTLPEPWSTDAWQRIATEMKHADVMVAPSMSYASTLSSRLDIPADDIQVVHSGIDLSGFPAQPRVPDVPTVAFMSRLAPEKGIEDLLRAFSEVRTAISQPVRLHLAGSLAAHEKPFMKNMMKRAEELNLQDVLTIETDVSRARKIEILANATVVSVPLRYPDAFGLFIPESWAAGSPVILPSTGASVELLMANPSGILYDDPGDLPRCMLDYLKHPDRALSEGQTAISFVREHMSIEKSAQHFLRALSLE